MNWQEAMIHYTCDRCRNLIENDELRYIVRLEIEATINDDAEDEKNDLDHLSQIDDLLDDVDAQELEELTQQIYQKRRFDLCRKCFQQFARNPLSADQPVAVNFSKN